MNKIASKLPFFYGWVVVAVALILGAFNTGVMVWGFGVFLIPMQAELGWTRATFFLPFGIGGIVSALLGPMIGPFVDRKHGPRIIYLLGSLGFGLSLVYMKYMDNVWMYLLVFGVIGGIGRASTRLAQSVLPKWFVRRRALAQSVVITGTNFGPLLFPVAIQLLISAVGWRDTWFVTGVCLIIVMVPASILVFRSPEDIGLTPDGIRADATVDKISSRENIPEPAISRSIAIRTPQFWLLVVALSAGLFAIRGMLPNLVPLFVARGISQTLAAMASTAFAFIVITTSILWGLILDKIGSRGPFLLASAMTISAFFLMNVVNGPMAMFLVMAYLGLGLTGFFVVSGVIPANIFGRSHIGAIWGAMQPFSDIAMFGAPVVFAMVYDFTQSYTWMVTLAAFSWFASLVAGYFLPEPRRN